MTDVHDLLARTHDALGAEPATLDPARRDALVAGVRRRRTRRHAAETLGVTALVVVVGAGGWLGLRGTGEVQPAEPPAPAPTAAPLPSEAPFPQADPPPAPTAPGLVPAAVLPDGALRTTAAGWVLTTQRPSAYVPDEGWTDPTAHVLDLVDPQGTRYRVLDLPLDLRVEVAQWDAGSTQALVVVGEGFGDGRAARLDLVSGELTDLDGLGSVSSYVGRTVAGDLWADSSGRLLLHDGTAVVRELPGAAADGLPGVGPPLLDATGERVAGWADGPVVVVDVATGKATEVVPASDVPCTPYAWHGTELLVGCQDDSGPDGPQVTVLRVDTTDPAGEPRPLTLSGDLVPAGSGAALADGRVALPHTPYLECPTGWGLLDVEAGSLVDVDVPDLLVADVTATGDVVLVTVTESCSGWGSPVRVLRYDATTGAQLELAGVPAVTDVPTGAAGWVEGTTSAVLATQP